MHYVWSMKRATFDSHSVQRRIMRQNLSFQTVRSHLIHLSSFQIKRRSCVELNAAIRFGA